MAMEMPLMARHLVPDMPCRHWRRVAGAGLHARQGQHQHKDQAQEPRHEATIAHQPMAIQIAMAIIIRFSVSETKPSGTLLLPPTQAHLRVRLSI